MALEKTQSGGHHWIQLQILKYLTVWCRFLPLEKELIRGYIFSVKHTQYGPVFFIVFCIVAGPEGKCSFKEVLK